MRSPVLLGRLLLATAVGRLAQQQLLLAWTALGSARDLIQLEPFPNEKAPPLPRERESANRQSQLELAEGQGIATANEQHNETPCNLCNGGPGDPILPIHGRRRAPGEMSVRFLLQVFCLFAEAGKIASSWCPPALLLPRSPSKGEGRKTSKPALFPFVPTAPGLGGIVKRGEWRISTLRCGSRGCKGRL